jgi:hypothetical protein
MLQNGARHCPQVIENMAARDGIELPISIMLQLETPLAVAGLRGENLFQERDKLLAGMSWGCLAEDLTGLGFKAAYSESVPRR